MGVNSCLLAFLLIHALLVSHSNLTVQAAESVSGSVPWDPIPPSHDFSNKLKVVSRRTLRSPPPPPRIRAPYHFKSPPPSPPPPCRPSAGPPPPPPSLWQPPM